jgi:ribosomal protein S18 acetylase RimI-like enzyme
MSSGGLGGVGHGADSVPRTVFDRLEQFYDAVPRDASRTEHFGGLVLFVRDGPGMPFYARPRLDWDTEPTATDIDAVRTRQRELGVPEAFEWVHERCPVLRDIARSVGLSVLEAPLMVLDHSLLPDPSALSTAQIRFADPAEPGFSTDLGESRAIASLGFAAGGTDIGAGGSAERDATVRALSAGELADERECAARGGRVTAIAQTVADGPVATGTLMRVGDVAEIAGIATLPSARCRGLGAAIAAALARRGLASGADLVFLTAGGDDIARVYRRAGFRRIGTGCIAEADAQRS